MGAAQSAKLQRRQHTIDLLAAFSTAEPLARSDFELARLIWAGEPICDDMDPEADAHVTNVLDLYEFVARGARRPRRHRLGDLAARAGDAGTAHAARAVRHGPTRLYGNDLCAGIERLLRAHDLLPPAESHRTKATAAARGAEASVVSSGTDVGRARRMGRVRRRGTSTAVDVRR